MTTPITKSDIERELRISFENTYTDLYFSELVSYAQARLEEATSRTTFTGSSQYLAKKCMIIAAVEWISMFDRELFDLAVSSISENGATLSFTGKGLDTYLQTFEKLAAKLRIPSTTNYNIYIADIADEHTGTETSILY